MRSAVIFDMDGVLIDSEYHFIKRTLTFAQKYQLDFNYDDACRMVGLCYHDYIQKLSSHFGIEENEFLEKFEAFKNEYKMNFKDMLNEDAICLLNWLHEKNISVGLATSTYSKNLEIKLNETGLKDSFDSIFAGDMLKLTKPHPEIYIESVKKLGMKPEECIAIEDSTVGIRSAHDAGLFVIARRNAHYDVDQSLADVVVDDLRDVIKIFEEIR